MIQEQAIEKENYVGANDTKTFRFSISFVLLVLAIFFFVSAKIFLTKTAGWAAGIFLSATHMKKKDALSQ